MCRWTWDYCSLLSLRVVGFFIPDDPDDLTEYQFSIWQKCHEASGEPLAYIGNDVRFDERDVETEYGPDNEAPADQRAGNG